MFRMLPAAVTALMLSSCATEPFGPLCGQLLPEGEAGLCARGTADEEAARFAYYRCLAAEDVEEGQYRLGIAYEEGLGTDIDRRKARKWYRKATAPKSGFEYRTSWRSGSTAGQILPYPTGQKSDGHLEAKRRLGIMHIRQASFGIDGFDFATGKQWLATFKSDGEKACAEHNDVDCKIFMERNEAMGFEVDGALPVGVSDYSRDLSLRTISGSYGYTKWGFKSVTDPNKEVGGYFSYDTDGREPTVDEKKKFGQDKKWVVIYTMNFTGHGKNGVKIDGFNYQESIEIIKESFNKILDVKRKGKYTNSNIYIIDMSILEKVI